MTSDSFNPSSNTAFETIINSISATNDMHQSGDNGDDAPTAQIDTSQPRASPNLDTEAGQTQNEHSSTPRQSHAPQAVTSAEDAELRHAALREAFLQLPAEDRLNIITALGFVRPASTLPQPPLPSQPTPNAPTPATADLIFTEANNQPLSGVAGQRTFAFERHPSLRDLGRYNTSAIPDFFA